jgi:hypothetical protein
MKPFASVHFSYCPVRVKIAVFFLGQAYPVYQAVKIGFQLRIGFCLQRIGSALNYFENIRIIKGINGLKFSRIEASRNFEILYPSRRFTISESNRDRYLSIFNYPGSPEIISEPYRSKRNRPDGIILPGSVLLTTVNKADSGCKNAEKISSLV